MQLGGRGAEVGGEIVYQHPSHVTDYFHFCCWYIRQPKNKILADATYYTGMQLASIAAVHILHN